MLKITIFLFLGWTLKDPLQSETFLNSNYAVYLVSKYLDGDAVKRHYSTKDCYRMYYAVGRIFNMPRPHSRGNITFK